MNFCLFVRDRRFGSRGEPRHRWRMRITDFRAREMDLREWRNLLGYYYSVKSVKKVNVKFCKIFTVILVFRMIRSQNSVVTSTHVELSFTQSNFILSLFRIIERGKNGFVSLVKRSVLLTFFYFHLLYNVCYSMARTENSQESVGSENVLVKTPMVHEDSNENSEPVLTGGECVLVSKSCSHLNSAINLNQIRKNVLKNGGIPSMSCHYCRSNSADGDNEEPEDLILCMRCGEGCCTSHVSKHYETPRSEPHVVYVNTNDWNVNCMECKSDSIPVDANGRLRESINLLKNSHNKPKPFVEISKSEPVLSSTAIESTPSTTLAYRNSDTPSSLAVMIGNRPLSALQPPRGLTNLGNTCFFNSVLQCLARTPLLVPMLYEMKEPGEKVIMKLEPHDPVEVTLHEVWGSVTEALVSTLMQITFLSNQSAHAFTPHHLLQKLREKHSQFKGYNQHDAHELLRTLLDCVKNEDLKRYRIEICRYFGLTIQKINPENVDEKKKALAQEMSKKLPEIVNIRPDPVFRGFTVSANTCLKCSHKSEIPESFLDLSLPVSFLRLQPLLMMNRRKNDVGEKPKSKHQLKKERKLARKNKKLAKSKKRCNAFNDQNNKNVEKSSVETKDVNESGYSSGKASSPMQSNSDNTIHSENNNEMLAEALDEINALPLEDNEVDASNKLAETSNVNSFSCDTPRSEVPISDNSSVVVGTNGSSSQQIDSHDVASTSFQNTIVDHEAAKISEQSVVVTSPAGSSSCFPLANTSKLSNNVGANGSSSSAGEDDDDDMDDENEDDDNDVDDSDEGDGLLQDNSPETRELCMTLQPHPTGEDEENSIWACLREYTKCEVLTDNNKVVCEKCTKEASKSTGEKKQIYRNFTKQLLIKSPPPVLILHLKRFEAKGAFSFRKVDANISFPLILDVGSFCSVTCEKLLYPDQKKILYSLYGIVEHSGSMNAGHYVAYVKVRCTTKHSYRKLFLPKNMHQHTETFSDESMEKMLKELQNEERQWYHISDSAVRPVAEEDVLRKQAYLLFYERIW